MLVLATGVMPITALPWVTRITGVTGPSAWSTVCSAVSSAGEAPTGAVQPRNESAVRKNGALFFEAMRTAAVRYLAFNPVTARLTAAPNFRHPA